jgi:D-threo-aldose 1-dehydrogenase
MSNAVLLALRSLGRTGLKVSPLCIGGAPPGNMPETFNYSVNEKQVLALFLQGFILERTVAHAP